MASEVLFSALRWAHVSAAVGTRGAGVIHVSSRGQRRIGVAIVTEVATKQQADSAMDRGRGGRLLHGWRCLGYRRVGANRGWTPPCRHSGGRFRWDSAAVPIGCVPADGDSRTGFAVLSQPAFLGS